VYAATEEVRVAALPLDGGVFIWSTYAAIKVRVEAFGCGLRHHVGVPARSRIGICATNCEAWLVTDLALIVSNVVSVPLDPPATAAELAAVVVKGVLGVVVCSPAAAATLLALVHSGTCSPPLLTTLIIIDELDLAGTAALFEAHPSGHAALCAVSLVRFSEVEAAGAALVARGEASLETVYSKPNPDALMTVIFSSGSTGA
jgi:long-subunit acyl-CoA synthetase (AMP-forming)